MHSLLQALARIGKQPPIRIPSELWVPSKSLRDTLNAWDPFDYGITVFTGTLDGAGTDANVYITLYGESTQSGEFSLDNDEDNFERRKIDYFEVIAPDLGELRYIRIRHDNSGSFPEWFLSKVIVVSLRTQQQWTFYCNRWLSMQREDRIVDRILHPKTECIEYRITVVTGSAGDSRGGAPCLVTLRGEHGDSYQVLLTNGNENYEPGQTDYFVVYSRDLGDLTSIQIHFQPWLKDNYFTPYPWFLSAIRIENLRTLQIWQVACSHLFTKGNEVHEFQF